MALYNTFLYNEEQFNGFQLEDLITMADTTIAIALNIVLSDTIFSNELLTKQITNKGLADSIKTADWVAPKRLPTNTEWFD